MQMSIHYYILSFSKDKSRLYEGFRDTLIDIDDGNFPIEIASIENHRSINARLKEFFHQTHQVFDQYYKQDPLRLVLVGEKSDLDTFESIKNHQDILIGKVLGNYIGTSSHDLGKIVWPVVREAISGINKNAIRELAIAARRGTIVSGIDAVGFSAETESGATLYVEEDYHVKGRLEKTNQSLIISKQVTIWQVLDNIVDIIIEKVLQNGGTVIFLSSGSLAKLGKIALIRG